MVALDESGDESLWLQELPHSDPTLYHLKGTLLHQDWRKLVKQPRETLESNTTFLYVCVHVPEVTYM